MEKWKPVNGYDGIYSVSNFGRVRRDLPEANTYSGRIMKTNNKHRYQRITLTKQGEQKLHTVHKLVTRAFLGNPPEGHIVNHRDGDRYNNNLKNLEYVTHKENMAHAIKHGFQPQGSRAYNSKLTESNVLYIRNNYVRGKVSQQSLADKFGVSQLLISIIIRRKRWRHI